MLRPLAVALAVLMLLAGSATAYAQTGQNATLSITGAGVSFPTPGGAAYDTGYIHLATPLQFTVTGNKWKFNQDPTLTESVQLACSAGCGAVQLQCSLVGSGSWNTLTTTFVEITRQRLGSTGPSDQYPTFGGSIDCRVPLSWTGNPAGQSTTFQVSFRLVQTP